MKKRELNFELKQKLTSLLKGRLKDWYCLYDKILNNVDKDHPIKAFVVNDNAEKNINYELVTFTLNQKDLLEIVNKTSIDVDDSDLEILFKKKEEIRNRSMFIYKKFIYDFNKINLFANKSIDDVKMSMTSYIFCKEVYQGRYPNIKEFTCYIDKLNNDSYSEFGYIPIKKFSNTNSKRYLKQINKDWFLGFEVNPNLFKQLLNSNSVTYNIIPSIVLIRKDVEINTKKNFYYSHKENNNIAGILFPNHFFNLNLGVLDYKIELTDEFQKKHFFHHQAITFVFKPLLSWIEEVVLDFIKNNNL